MSELSGQSMDGRTIDERQPLPKSKLEEITRGLHSNCHHDQIGKCKLSVNPCF
jgi:hypothetical protein